MTVKAISFKLKNNLYFKMNLKTKKGWLNNENKSG